VFVTEGVEPYKAARCSDLAEDETGPHRAAVRELHAVVEDAAWLELEVCNFDAAAGGPHQCFRCSGSVNAFQHLRGMR